MKAPVHTLIKAPELSWEQPNAIETAYRARHAKPASFAPRKAPAKGLQPVRQTRAFGRKAH